MHRLAAGWVVLPDVRSIKRFLDARGKQRVRVSARGGASEPRRPRREPPSPRLRPRPLLRRVDPYARVLPDLCRRRARKAGGQDGRSGAPQGESAGQWTNQSTRAYFTGTRSNLPAPSS